jgi:hypothetical protein
MKKILVSILLISLVSCGKYPEEDVGTNIKTNVGRVYSANPDEVLTVEETELVASVCSQLKTKQSNLYDKYYPNPSQTFPVQTYEKSCLDADEGKTVEFEGKFIYQNDTLSVLSTNDSAMVFSDLVTDKTPSLSAFCSSVIVDNRMKRQYISGSSLKSITLIASTNQKCRANSEFACLGVTTAFQQTNGTFKASYEEVFVLDKSRASQFLAKRRDLFRSCDLDSGFSIRSQSFL